MSNIEKFLWGMKFNYYRNKEIINIVKGDRKKALEYHNKVLDLIDVLINKKD